MYLAKRGESQMIKAKRRKIDWIQFVGCWKNTDSQVENVPGTGNICLFTKWFSNIHITKDVAVDATIEITVLC